ncbi:hypothetical protein B0H13DRAFT_2364593 [Mycena leptocephala]|nr:hypothetical protein B0H13DRAFT_2364593 [Mycena leptocephala]
MRLPSSSDSLATTRTLRRIPHQALHRRLSLAAALHSTYTRRGLCVDSQRNLGMRAVDPFRSALSNAVLWSSNLQTRINARVSVALADAASELGLQSTTASTVPPSVPGPPPGEALAQNVADADTALITDADTEAANDSTAAGREQTAALHASNDSAPPAREQTAGPPTPDDSSPPTHEQTADTASSPVSDDPAPPMPPAVSSDASDRPPPPREQPALTPGRADRILRERCPACFGLETWGRPLKEGGDVQLGGDGCFSYRHLKSAGDARMDAAKNKPAIPQEALDACESSWEAANEKKQKADPQRYDASGVFAITCRHLQVLFLCNIDTPGEQQQYIVAGLEVVQEHPPALPLYSNPSDPVMRWLRRDG